MRAEFGKAARRTAARKEAAAVTGDKPDHAEELNALSARRVASAPGNGRTARRRNPLYRGAIQVSGRLGGQHVRRGISENKRKADVP